jgi:hypothetical protein
MLKRSLFIGEINILIQSKMKLVTVATHSERYYPYLKISAERYGHELITLGWGQKWKGFAWRFELMKEYLRSVEQDEIVCFIDAFDVVVLETPRTIEQKFIELTNGDTSRVLISKEQYSHNGIENGILSYLQSFVFTKCKEEYVNAGTYMGTASTLLELYEKICNEFKCAPDTDDQRLIQDYCMKNNTAFIIDNECSIFLVINSTLSKIKKDEYHINFINNKLLYNDKIFPAFFHGNGYTDFDYIIEKLGYDTSLFTADGESKSKFIWGRIMGFLPIAFQRIWIYMLIFILGMIYIFRKKLPFLNKSKKIKSYK